MSADKFKFLNNKQSGGDAAQNFLNEKLSKNKYMSTSDPSNPYSMGEGSTPGGEAYELDRKVLNQDEIDKFNANKGNGEGELSKTYGSLSDLGFDDARIEEIRKHAQGASGSGSFGYTSDTEHHFRETEDRTSSGSIEADMRKIGKHMGYEHWGTANPERIKKWIMEEGEGGEAPEPVLEEMKPIEHSAEIKQAKDRVQSYEEDVMSGKTSNEIYGKGETLAEDKYNFDASLGASAIGGSPIAKADANNAAASFLNKKVADAKKTLQLS